MPWTVSVIHLGVVRQSCEIRFLGFWMHQSAPVHFVAKRCVSFAHLTHGQSQSAANLTSCVTRSTTQNQPNQRHTLSAELEKPTVAEQTTICTVNNKLQQGPDVQSKYTKSATEVKQKIVFFFLSSTGL